MREILLFFLILFFWGCEETSLVEEDLHHLNGYWEITEVTFQDGAEKNYTVNPSVDFIQLKGTKGYRKKVQPKFDGTFSTSDDAEVFEVFAINKGFTLQYKNSLSEREEKLVQLDSISFSVRSEDGILYSYKRFEPISIPK
ncbi:hypothetical protein DKG77_08775 [Flagellimonas aquimarina]|uniref:Lipocalin-like domain-containing protein n=1 Tax=Flagellimonas aquimarina TaxID=2201895 RepID=A0A316KXG2_9FLAO|nr:hypothetical protein [Allomuricauda koreensis]PWL38356.1 hypothetical protein DKG77_08775 [Allomuricauda koreensis]